MGLTDMYQRAEESVGSSLDRKPNTEQPNAQVLVERPVCLVPFDDLKAEIEQYKIENQKQVFDYKTPEGEKAARSHCYKLRLVKGQNKAIHGKAKANALAECQMIDGEKNFIDSEIDKMVDYHMIPINEIAKARKDAEEAQAEAEKAAAAEVEKKRMAVIAENEAEAARILEEVKAKRAKILKDEEDRQARIAAEEKARMQAEFDRQAKIKAEADKLQKVIDDAADKLAAEREKFEAEKKAEADAKAREKQAVIDIKEKVEQDKKDALAKAEQEKEDAINEEKRIAHQKENDRIAKDLEDKLEQDRVDELDRQAKADEEHQSSVKIKVWHCLNELIGNEKLATDVNQAIIAGEIPHVSINY